MTRKGTAVILLWLMSVTIVTSQPALHYCLRLETIFLNGCPCPAAEKEATTSSCECDSCSPDRGSPALPCGECSVDLVYHLGDFVCTSAHETGPMTAAADAPLWFSWQDDGLRMSGVRASIYGIRGGPPPPLIPPAVPLRLRYSVFLV